MSDVLTRERAYRMRAYPTARRRRVLGWLFAVKREVWNKARKGRDPSSPVWNGTQTDRDRTLRVVR